MHFGTRISGLYDPSLLLGDWVSLVATAGLEESIAAYQGAGFEVVLLLARESFTPTQLTQGAWATALFDYCSLYPTVKTYIIGNEPDGQKGSASWALPRKTFINLLRKSAVVASALGKQLVIGPMAGGLGTGTNYLRDVLQGFDALPACIIGCSANVYGQRVAPDFPAPNWGFGDLPDLLTGFTAQAHAAGLAFWLTEFNIADEALRPEYVTRFVQVCADQGGVDHLSLFCFHDYAAGANDGSTNWGLVRDQPDGPPLLTPTYHALRDGLALLPSTPQGAPMATLDDVHKQRWFLHGDESLVGPYVPEFGFPRYFRNHPEIGSPVGPVVDLEDGRQAQAFAGDVLIFDPASNGTFPARD